MASNMDIKLTDDEVRDYMNLKSKINDLTHKERLKLAVYQNILKKTNKSSDTVASREAADLGKTENDYYKKEGEKLFKTSDDEVKNNCNYEYTTSELNITNDGDAVFKRKVRMKTIVKDTICRCELAEKILNKRALTAAEELELKDLKFKRANHRADYDEEMRCEELMRTKINPGEREVAEFIKGVHKCFYYKNANKVLIPGSNYREWNMEITNSAEPSGVIELCQKNKHASIGVFFQDPIDYAAKLKKAPLNRNPVVVIDANRLGPGGAWERGEEGIEEQIFLRTTVSLAVDREISDHFYPLKNESVIYVPKTMIFRQNKATDYKVLEDNKNPDFQSFIFASGAIVKQTQITGDDVKEDLNDKTDMEIYVDKIKNCMATALFNGHDSIVFTALGCYNYKRSFEECADAFLYSVFDPRTMFYRRFRSIVFCVPPDVMPLVVETYDVVDGASKKTMQRTIDNNALLCQILQSKLHQSTVQNIIFSTLPIHEQLKPKSVLNDVFSGLKL